MSGVTNLTNLCIIGVLILILSLNGSVAQFGSKVISGDVDEGRLLEPFHAGKPHLQYWDVSGDLMYTGEDIVYLDIQGNGWVDLNDIRLTSYGANPAGSKVRDGDNDIGSPLFPMTGPDCGIYFLDLYGFTPGYDQSDPVYILANADFLISTRTTINDIRLSEANGLAPGTRVFNFHSDHDKIATPMITTFTTLPTGTMATIRFYNGNGNVDISGNPLYDADDDVYLDISVPDTYPFGFVVPNNLRLSG